MEYPEPQPVPHVTVLIPTYNMGVFVSEAVSSALDQDLVSVEVLVVDDGSTDETQSKLAAFQDKRLRTLYVENGGKSKALNYAISKAKGRYLCVLDADDLMLPHGLTSRVDAAEREGARLVIGGFEVFERDETLGSLQAYPSTSPTVQRLRLAVAPVTPFALSGCLFERSLAHEVGPFDETLRRGQDHDYAFRMLARVGHVAIVPGPVYRYRRYRASRRERLRLRARTVFYRRRSLWKNLHGFEKLLIPIAAVFDLLKLVYGFFGDYQYKSRGVETAEGAV